MSAKPGGQGANHCDVCGRVYTWGCGHSGAQESRARRHLATRKHKNRECECYGHNYCDASKCKLAGKRIPGYVPFFQHTDPKPDLVEIAIQAVGATL